MGAYDSAPLQNGALSYEELVALERQTDALYQKEMLSGVYDERRRCFAITGGAKRYSITSTCFALLALDAEPERWHSAAAGRASARLDHLQVDAVLEALLVAEWRESDLYQATSIVTALRLIDPHARTLRALPAVHWRVASAIETLIDNRPMRRNGRKQPVGAYLRYCSARALMLLLAPPAEVEAASAACPADAPPGSCPPAASLLASAHPDAALPAARQEVAEAVLLALERSAETAYDDLCRQLAFRAASDDVSFDVVVLAYSLITYTTISRLQQTGVLAVGREDDARDAVGSGSALPPYNARLVATALDAVFEQMRGGLWPKGQPIFLSRGGGNDVGNAFVFAPDMLASLLEALPAEDLRCHTRAISSHLAWLSEHLVTEPGAALGDRPLLGWRSNHLPPEGGPLTWSTAQAMRCISRTRKLVRSLLTADVLAEFGGKQATTVDPTNWDRLLDSDLPSGVVDGGGDEAAFVEKHDKDGDGHLDEEELTSAMAAGGGSEGTLKALLQQRMIEPLARLSEADYLGRDATAESAEAPVSLTALQAKASYSAILFGPPGTAKSTVVEALANRLGWGFVVIDTSVFLSDGLSNVAGRIAHVFDKLQQLDQVVILLDEVEEFCMDRSNPALSMESRMLTTAMLTKLADLRAARRSAFFIATNRLRALDAAVTRPGRFDLQLFVGTPNRRSRAARFAFRLAGLTESQRLAPDQLDAAERAFASLLAARWERDAMFLTFLETERLAADAVAATVLACSDGEGCPTEDEFLEVYGSLLDQQVPVMTVRGSVRQEFVDSMRLSRT